MTDEYLLKLQSDYENNFIKDCDLTKEEKNALINLYKSQNDSLSEEIRNLKIKYNDVVNMYHEIKDTE